MTETLSTETAYKAVDFIETYTGLAFHPLRPDPRAITIIDIAHALANQCRYSGHTGFFYSTAQHCCLLASFVEGRNGTPLDCLQILMHDAAEAYLVDIPRPIKQFMPEYRKWDHDVTLAIREWYGCKGIDIPKWQDELDSRIIQDERKALMSESGLNWQHQAEPLGIDIELWPAEKAEDTFLKLYALYMARVRGSWQYLRRSWGISDMITAYTPFESASTDIMHDLVEVDLLGNTGKLAVRDERGMMVRDPEAGKKPRPLYKWIHGQFKLVGGETAK